MVLQTPPPSSYPSPSSPPSRHARNHAQEVWARQRTGTHTKPALNGRTRDTQTQTTQIAQRIGAFRNPGDARSLRRPALGVGAWRSAEGNGPCGPPRTAPLALERKERTHVSHAGAVRRAHESAEACSSSYRNGASYDPLDCWSFQFILGR